MQQTISLPFTISDSADVTWLTDAMRQHASVVRTGYARAANPDRSLRAEKDLRDELKTRFPDHPLGSWAIHCATREALRLRKQKPDGRMIFGGRAQLERRMKELISHEEWRQRRQSRPIEIVGDRTRWGNRHLRLSEDGRTATVVFLKRSIRLDLPKMSGKTGMLLKALARLTEACEIGISFTLGAKSLSISFDPMDLRRLPEGTTLEQIERVERKALGRKAKGRPRKDPSTHYAEHRIKPIPAAERPVHPEWRPTIQTTANRAVGIDLNPQWIGLTVVEIGPKADPRDADSVRILDHRLIRLDIGIDVSSEAFATHMARCARLATSLARKWGCATILHEDDLGRLRWSKRSNGVPKDAATINFWSRNALLDGLARRCALSGLTLSPIWGGYSSTIGNMLFDLPDACAAAAEIARRGVASTRGEKDRLPAVPPRVLSRRWKDGEVPRAVADATADATCWKSVHRIVKAARIGVRRPHPPLTGTGSGIPRQDVSGYAVRSNGSRKGGRMTTAGPILRRAA